MDGDGGMKRYDDIGIQLSGGVCIINLMNFLSDEPTFDAVNNTGKTVTKLWIYSYWSGLVWKRLSHNHTFT